MNIFILSLHDGLIIILTKQRKKFVDTVQTLNNYTDHRVIRRV